MAQQCGSTGGQQFTQRTGGQGDTGTLSREYRQALDVA